MFIRSLLTALCAVIVSSAAPARAADPANLRMITTNSTESAPLNLISRAFIRLEPAFAAHVEAQRLTYLARRAANAGEAMIPGLRSLLANISSDASTITLAAADTDSQTHRQIENFLRTVNQNLDTAAASRPATADAIERLKLALNSCITRQDMKAFSATVSEDNVNTFYFILLDEETSDLLLLSLSTGR